MMKYIKRCILAVLVLIILLLATVFILTTFYKKEIADTLIKNLKTNYALTLKVSDVDVSLFENFPQASINLKDVYLDNDLHPASEPLLKAGKVTVSFSLRKLIKNEFEINAVTLQEAHINLVTHEDGSKNFQFKTNDTLAQKKNTLDFNIHKIAIENTQLDFFNRQKKQHIGVSFIDNDVKLRKNPEGFNFTLKGNIKVDELLFKSNKGAFLANTPVALNLEGVLYTAAKSCFIHDPSSLEIEGITYAVNTFIDLGEKKNLLLKISTPAMTYQKGVKLLNKKIGGVLSNFNISKPFDISFLLVTSLNVKQDPIVLVKINTAHNNISIGNSKIPYEDISFKGFILSLDSSLAKGNEEQAIIRFSGIKGTIYEVPFAASVKVNGFTNSAVSIDASLFINAQKVKLKASEEFDLKGNCIARIHYAGPADKITKQEFLSDHMKLRASLAFKNFSYKEKHKPYVYMVNGKANLTNTNLSFNGLILKTNGGNVTLNGKLENFTPYVLGMSSGLKINLSAYANEFDLNPFMKTKTSSQQTSNTSQTKAVKKLDDESNFDFNVSLKANKMLIRKVVAEDVYMNLAYKNSLLNVRSLTMNTCGGKLNASAVINNLESINADIHVDDINVTTLFEQFENFGQQAIQGNQLKGKISLNARFNTNLDDKMDIIPASMAGDVKLKLKEGHLLNYEPLQNISNFIFHNRDFNDITFSEVNESFRLKGYEMQIEELEIASNVLNLFVSGTYNFKSQSNINLVIPWSNLKRRGKNYIPKSSGLSAEDTKGLKLNYAGTPKKMKLSLGHK